MLETVFPVVVPRKDSFLNYLAFNTYTGNFHESFQFISMSFHLSLQYSFHDTLFGSAKSWVLKVPDLSFSQLSRSLKVSLLGRIASKRTQMSLHQTSQMKVALQPA